MAERSRFGEVLRKQRVARALTQEELAARAQLSPRAISDLERGLKHAPRWSTVRLLVTGLELGSADAAELTAAARSAVDDGQLASVGSASTRNNLPSDVSTFIGREWELGELPAQLASTRLLTLTGPGGVGKTRLALRLAQSVVELYTDGVWLVQLAPLGQPQLVSQAVAGALGVREEGHRPMLESLRVHLAARELLLVLDNCEHLVEACAELVEDLLRACPGVRLLATSREPLAIGGETVWRVSSMRSPGRGDLSAVQLREYEAVRLFVERAQAVQPVFEVTEDNAPAIALVCRRLDGLPLAIELAAARLNVLTPAQIAARLEDRLRLLVGGRRAAPARQQTLKATLDWSYDLLSEAERRLLRTLAVFAGGCSLEAVEAVCGDNAIQSYDVLNLLGQLVDKSLVIAEPVADGTVRYGLHETLRQYGLERLADNGELERARRQHARYYTDYVEPAVAGLKGQGQARLLQLLALEHDNLRAAISWALETAEIDVGLQLGAALWRFWDYRGFLAEGDSWLTRVLAPAAPCSPALLQAMFGAGRLALIGGDTVRARARFQDLRVRALDAGDQPLTAAALTQLGQMARDEGDLATARSLTAEALVIRKGVGDDWGAAISLESLGVLALTERDTVAARRLLTESLELTRSVADSTRVAFVLCTLGQVDLAEGDLAASRAHFLEGLTLFRELKYPQGVARALQCFAELAVAAGQPERGLRLFGASASQREAFGYVFSWLHGQEHRWETAARRMLGVDAADAAWVAGHAMPIEQVEQALEEGIAMSVPANQATTIGDVSISAAAEIAN